MAVIDISARLKDEKNKVKIAEGFEIEINDSVSAVIDMQQALDAPQEESTNAIYGIMTAIQCVVSEEDFKRLEEMEFSFKDWITVCEAVVSAATGAEFEPGRFQKAAGI